MWLIIFLFMDFCIVTEKFKEDIASLIKVLITSTDSFLFYFPLRIWNSCNLGSLLWDHSYLG